MAQPFPKNDIEDDGNQFLAAAAEKDALVGRRIWRQFAIYHPVVTPMHKGNPYIEALPHNPSREELIKNAGGSAPLFGGGQVSACRGPPGYDFKYAILFNL